MEMKNKNWWIPLLLLICFSFLIPSIVGHKAHAEKVPIQISRSEQSSDADILAYLQSVNFSLYTPVMSDQGPVFKESCTGFNYGLSGTGDMSLGITAGHCSKSTVLKIGAAEKTLRLDSMGYFFFGNDDLYFGLKPFCKNLEKTSSLPLRSSHGKFSAKVLQPGEIFYTLGRNGKYDEHGFFDRGLTKLRFIRQEGSMMVFDFVPSGIPGKSFTLLCGDSCDYAVIPGASGSLIVNKQKQAIGVAIGLNVFNMSEVYGLNLLPYSDVLDRAADAIKDITVQPGACGGEEK